MSGFACGAKLKATVTPPIDDQYLGKDVFYIGEICVLPEGRSTRLGLKLFRELIAQAMAGGVVYGLGVTRPDRKSVIELAGAVGLQSILRGTVTLGNTTNEAEVFWGKLQGL